MLSGALSRAAERALPHLPRALRGAFAEVFGTLAYLAAPGARRAVHANLAVIAPGRNTRGVAHGDADRMMDLALRLLSFATPE